MHHYEVKLSLNNGDTVTGIAHNVKVVKDGEERKEILELMLNTKEVIKVELIEIHSMRAIKENPHFIEIQLTSNKID